MKITDLIVESEQLNELTAADVGQGVGKAAGAVGAVAGGVKGAWQAAKKGFEKGRATVAGETPPQAQAAPATGTAAPAAAPGQAAPAAQGDANDPAGIQQQIKQKELELKDLQGKLRAAQKGADNAAKAEKDAAQTQQAQQVAKAPAAEPAAQQAAPAAAPDAATQARIAAAPQGYDGETGKPIAAPAAEPAPQTTTAAPAAEPAPAAPQQSGGKLTAAQQAAMKAKLQGKRAAGQTAGTTASGFNQYTKDASSQRIVGANPDGSPKIQQIKASKINLGNNLSESLARKIEQHKRKMFETGLTNGTSSVFVK
jgi:hypothetical protein